MGNRRVFHTLLYSDIFDYPLKKEEIWKYLISDQKITKKQFLNDLNKTKGISVSHGLYFLKDKKETVWKRLEKEKQSKEKLTKAKRLAKALSSIPSIQLIAVSGSLALLSSDLDDDIDFFIVTSKNTLWTTRLLAAFYLLSIGEYRKRGDKDVAGKICLNMFLDEESMSFDKKRRELYTAHEIAQLYPLIERGNTFSKFQKANSWLLDFLPNAFDEKKKVEKIKEIRWDWVLTLFEPFLKYIQRAYMKGNLTSEEVSDKILAFHPYNYKEQILKDFKKKLKNQG